MPWTDAEKALVVEIGTDALARDLALVAALRTVMEALSESGAMAQGEFIARLDEKLAGVAEAMPPNARKAMNGVADMLRHPDRSLTLH